MACHHPGLSAASPDPDAGRPVLDAVDALRSAERRLAALGHDLPALYVAHALSLIADRQPAPRDPHAGGSGRGGATDDP